MSVFRTYLDWNATAPLRREARAAMLAAMDVTGNPSSVHGEGREARAIVEDARRRIAELVGARASEVSFTSGGTEANNAVFANPWKRVLLSSVEHESVLAPARRCGAEIVVLPVDRNGVVVPEAVTKALAAVREPHATLLSIQMANNETGVIQPLSEIVTQAKSAGLVVHSDAVQAAGRMPLDFDGLGIDLMSMSGHKLGAPKGIGALIVRDGLDLPSLLVGGGQESRRRAGTENVVGIAGLGAAARAVNEELASFAGLGESRAFLEKAIKAIVPGSVIVGAGAERLANTVCFTWPGQSAETLLIKMDLGGVAVSSGAACSSGKVGPSHVLAAMGLPDDASRSALRVSFGVATDEAAFARFVAVLTAIANRTAGQSAATMNMPGGPASRLQMMMGEA